MWRIGACSPRVLLTVALASAVWWGTACAGGQTGTARTATPGGGVTLEAELHHEGFIVLRSPTFR